VLPASPQGERLNITRIGHPARVIPHDGALNCTLEAQAERSNEVRVFHALCLGVFYFIPVRPPWQET
jgi:hypothetical protein